ncbi:MAG: aminodeoxychorismate synthase component I, partial [Ignavibacteriaceae bacterium]|nr:aminodeoxychorismate synthase component I [Ignavibacteriaceae bacterium]
MQIKNLLKSVSDIEHAAFFYTPVVYPNAESILFEKSAEIISAYGSDDFLPSIKRATKFLNKGLTGFMLLKYEAGYLLEKKTNKYFSPSNKPVLKIVLFDKNNVNQFPSSSIIFEKDDFIKSFEINNFGMNTTREEYSLVIEKIKNYIAAGETYQVNYTVKGKFDFRGSLQSLFLNLLFNQSARYTAFINDDEETVISLSPELFFKTKHNIITTRPMKGTATRGLRHSEDETQKYLLTHSEKEKAENLMIVDLLRNDLGKISKTGTVRVKKLFDVEKYESLLQMVSTIKGDLREDVDLPEIIKNIFPCGSITGAPKINTIKIIKEVEKEERGIYTGAIGLLNKKETAFNVAIRTVVINNKTRKGEIGLGSGIVWDSEADREYDEVILKSRFLTSPNEYFEIFETMLVKGKEVAFLYQHIERMKNGASFFLFCFDEEKVKNEIEQRLSLLNDDEEYRYRLSLTKWGGLNHQITGYKKYYGEVKVIISSKQTNKNCKFLFFKTTERKLYDAEHSLYSARGFFDVLFFNEKGELTEGAITNVFVKIGGEVYTPPSKCGLLTGIYRD